MAHSRLSLRHSLQVTVAPRSLGQSSDGSARTRKRSSARGRPFNRVSTLPRSRSASIEGRPVRSVAGGTASPRWRCKPRSREISSTVTENEFAQLLYRGESESLDFKSEQYLFVG